MLKVREIQIVPCKPQNGLIAFISLVWNNELYLSDIALYTRPEGGYRLLYPTRKLSNGKQIEIFFPINKEAGRVIEDAVIDKYCELTLKFRNLYKN